MFEEQYCKKHGRTYNLPAICPGAVFDRMKEQAARNRQTTEAGRTEEHVGQHSFGRKDVPFK